MKERKSELISKEERETLPPPPFGPGIDQFIVIAKEGQGRKDCPLLH